MIPRKILFNKPGKKQYICNGKTCEKCMLRYRCLTSRNPEIFEMDYISLRKEYGGSPQTIARIVFGGKAFISGSKKYSKFSQRRGQLLEP